MNAVEIEEAVSELASQPFDRDEFPFQFLTAFGMKDTTVRRLRTGSSNSSDVPGGVLQRSNIHIATSPAGQVGETLAALRASPKTAAGKAKFILATDGDTLEAEDLTSGEAIACEYADLPQHFGFFLPLAGISTVTEIKNNPIDIKATGRLNKLYVELLKDNPDWGTKEKRPALNQFMARLIFCFFAEDTGIFLGEGLFTSTIARMSTPGHGSGENRWGNTHEVLSELFRAMATDTRHNGQLDGRHRKAAGIKSWADVFPYVNGGLFSGSVECPKFSRIARSYLLRAGELSWKEINPDIFGSMIQAVADDDERGELGMHYTSVPNILKVLNPLFLDHLREQLDAAGDNVRKLRNLRRRIAGIRVFDPACGSGNFLVIAYLKMRQIEHEIVQRTGDDPRSLIKLTNFYGIEIKSFAAEIARLSLLIAEFQADCRYISQQEARAMVLPLHKSGQIHVTNALRADWLSICAPAPEPTLSEHDLGGATGRLALDSIELSSETYICGNPPFTGTRKQSADQKEDLQTVFSALTSKWKNVDYVGGWFLKAAQHAKSSRAKFAFVATNSLCQGQQVPITWKLLIDGGFRIRFAHTSFKWRNLATKNAGVTVIVVGVDNEAAGTRYLFSGDERKAVDHINPYLTEAAVDIVQAERKPRFTECLMDYGVYYSKSDGLIVSPDERADLLASGLEPALLRRFIGTSEFLYGVERYCLWISDDEVDLAREIKEVADRIDAVEAQRLATTDTAVNKLAKSPHQFRERKGDGMRKLFIPIVSSENREWFPAGVVGSDVIPTSRAFFVPDAPMHALAVICSRLHLCWIGAICGRFELRYVYSNTLGWNTFPLPKLTDHNRNDLARSASEILLAREAHFPKTIAELYDPDDMPDDLRRAHEANDEVLERIYIGRRFRNDTERLEKLFELYTKMMAEVSSKRTRRAA